MSAGQKFENEMTVEKTCVDDDLHDMLVYKMTVDDEMSVNKITLKEMSVGIIIGAEISEDEMTVDKKPL